MPTVTKITVQKCGQRANVYLDGQFAFGLSLLELAKQGLKKGKHYNSSQLQSIINRVFGEKLQNKALHLLSLRPRTAYEISTRLQQYSIRLKIHLSSSQIEGLINKVISRLKKQNLVNDQQFACWWLEQRQNLKPIGPIRLTKELGQKGVDRDIIKETLASYYREGVAIKKIKKELVKKNSHWRSLTYLKRKKRLYHFLQRRGFNFNTCRTLVDQMLKKS